MVISQHEQVYNELLIAWSTINRIYWHALLVVHAAKGLLWAGEAGMVY